MPWTAWLRSFLRSPRWEDVVFWSLDLETSGLSPGSDRILSVALLPVRGGTIRYGERYASLVRPPDPASLSTEGLRAHHILPRDLESAPPIEAVLPEVDRRLREGVLLVHYAPLDLAFLREAYGRHGLAWPKPRAVDTVELLVRLHQRQHRFRPHPPQVRTSLAEARAALGLPPHRSHDALADALATAELFLVLRSRLDLCTLRALL
jgi:DNA polymerase-3 subunit epsilon